SRNCGSSEIVGHHHHHGLLPVGSHIKRSARELSCIVFTDGEHGDVETGCYGLLVNVEWTTTGSWCFTHDDDHGDASQLSFGQTGHHVGKAGTVGCGGHSQLSGSAVVSIGRGNGRDLVTHGSEGEFRRGQCRDQVNVAVSYQAEDPVNPLRDDACDHICHCFVLYRRLHHIFLPTSYTVNTLTQRSRKFNCGKTS